MVRELQTVKELGFNLLRKHAKIEPQRWYYHCDKLGLIVWQDHGQRRRVLQALVCDLPDQCVPAPAAEAAGQKAPVGSAWPGKADIPGGVRPGAGRHGENPVLSPLHRLLGTLQRGVGAVRCRRWRRQSRPALDDTRLVDEASGWYDQGGGDVDSSTITSIRSG